MPECQQCGRPLPADAVGGACPACLLGMARPAGSDPFGETRDRDVAGPPAWFPTVEKLNSRFPQFQVHALIGQGGMGAVYKAHQPSLDRAVAIKIMSPRLADDPSFAERFAREARTMARLNHQNIVNVYDFGSVDGLYYLVMEYVEGVNLRLAMKAGQLSAEQSLAIVPQVCEALQFAHDAGIVHRDIKPENILIDRRGRVKIADFGLAKLVAEENSQQWTLTGSRQVLGTLNYMAPEQIERPASVDHRADIYSLGVVLYELLTGELPLGRFQLPGEKHAGHAALDQIVARTLEKSPDRRFQQASEFRTAVEAARNSSGFRPIGPDHGDQPKPAKAHTAAHSAAPAPSDVRSPRVTFTIENPFHGMTVTHGVMKATGQGVAVDYSKRENVFQQPIGDQGKHLLAYSGILKAEFKEGWYTHTLVLELDSPASHAGLPSEKPGTLLFSIDGKNRDDAHRVVNAIREAIGQPLLVVRPEKPEESRARAQKRVAQPAAWLILAGLVNLLVVPGIFLWWFLLPGETIPVQSRAHDSSTASVQNAAQQISGDESGTRVVTSGSGSTSQNGEFVGAADESGFGDPTSGKIPLDPKHVASNSGQPPQLSFVTITSLVLGAVWMMLGGLLVSGGYCQASLKRWGWCVAVSIVAMVPVYPGWIIGLPAGIVSLAQIYRPSNREQFDRDDF